VSDHSRSGKDNDMKFDKSQILDLLRSQGDHDKASEAERELPGEVDTDRDKGILDKLGLDVGDILKKLGGGGLGKLLG
jgi:hypothetical protein